MLVEFKKLIYPSHEEEVKADSFMVAIYQPCERIRDAEGKYVREVKAVGYCLPMARNLRFRLKGHWSTNAGHGLQFDVEGFEDVIVHTREGILAYLSSGQIRGVGPALAERIFEEFGMDTLEVLDKEPERLMEVRGISSQKLENIISSYLENRGARDVVAFLAPHGISAHRAVQFYQEYGRKAMETVQEHPYRLCGIDGIGFRTADRIAMKMGVSRTDPERVDEGIMYTLKEQEDRGHLCMKKDSFIRNCLKTLDCNEVTPEMAGTRATRMVYSQQLVLYNGCVYRRKAYMAEDKLAGMIKDMLWSGTRQGISGLGAEIRTEEKELGITFAEEQKAAIRMALSEGLCVITGGPGTGKTMIQKAVLDIYRRHWQDNIICCAPTGRAARRLEQSTGFPASTVHRAVAACGAEDGMMLEADMVLVDEVSMLDIYLACRLFELIPQGTRLVLVGDADQLPSVGPGAVLSEMIASGCIPVVRLDHVYRQEEGGRIAGNAQKIRYGRTDLDFGEDFQFIESDDLEVSAELASRLYLTEQERYGIDGVALLTPFRKKTATGADALNRLIRGKVNPRRSGMKEISDGKKTFRAGDKVMQIKNSSDVSNGDTGYIIEVKKTDEGLTARIDFGDGRVKEYSKSEVMELLDLGYASTVHKSQGSEYDTVIINIQKGHYTMLNRPLIYTAVTRGKKKVIVIGEKQALYMAVRKLETERRGTNLAVRIMEHMKGVAA